MADELLQQRGLDQIRLLGDQGLLGQHHLLGGHRVGGEQAPVDVTAVPEVWVVGVLREAERSQGREGEATRLIRFVQCMRRRRRSHVHKSVAKLRSSFPSISVMKECGDRVVSRWQTHPKNSGGSEVQTMAPSGLLAVKSPHLQPW